MKSFYKKMDQFLSTMKIFKGALSGLKKFLANEIHLKMMKNTFYFTLESLFVLKIFNFLVMYKSGLIRKIRFISKFMTSQSGQQSIAIHILPNTSRSKDNQTMKFGQLIEYNKRETFVEKSYTKCDEETIPRPFSLKLKLSISLDQYS